MVVPALPFSEYFFDQTRSRPVPNDVSCSQDAVRKPAKHIADQPIATIRDCRAHSYHHGIYLPYVKSRHSSIRCWVSENLIPSGGLVVAELDGGEVLMSVSGNFGI
jgi:hypothetical protein